MKHLFFIDPLEKLNIRKDSTLMMALTAQKMGLEAYILFEKDFYFTNDSGPLKFTAYQFKGAHKEDGFYLQSFEAGEKTLVEVDAQTVIHMRIDPPYDVRYQRYLWMLDFIRQKTSCRITNDPIGIMKYNEKTTSYASPGAIDSYVGSSVSGFQTFVESLKQKGYKELILKPLDLYSGIGVQKLSLDSDLVEVFKKEVEQYHGAIVAQPFMQKVYSGEIRSIYLAGKEIGTILKVPRPGEFLANIAQGAKFELVELTPAVASACEQVSRRLHQDGIDLVAFDILGDSINEVNVTCPGLMVEVSFARGTNLCEQYLRVFF